MPNKFKTQSSAGKVITTVFWDVKRVTILDFLPKRSTITGVYYANFLDQLITAIREKRRGKLAYGVLLHQENTRVHFLTIGRSSSYSPYMAAWIFFFIFPSVSSRTTVIIRLRKMLKRVDERRYLCLTPTVDLNHSPVLLFI